ncbi:hypothetical protein GIX45_10350 [Erwinia sp. CPCC 100877]|nr:hypothetical protein [Erwinia sp. CPCC 100877]
MDVVSGISGFAKNEMGLSIAKAWSDSPRLNHPEIPFLEETERWQVVNEASSQGIIMASGEVLQLTNQSLNNQIAWPGSRWQMNPYAGPLVGIQGAFRLLDCWVNQPGLI